MSMIVPWPAQSLTIYRNTRQLTENDPRFGYFAKMMRPTYTEATEISGRRSSAASFELFILISTRHVMQGDNHDQVGSLHQ